MTAFKRNNPEDIQQAQVGAGGRYAYEPLGNYIY
jgi:hypothetical protein